LSCNGQTDMSKRARELAAGNGSMKHAVIRNGGIHWNWKREDFEDVEVLGSDEFWTLRLPLASVHGSLGYVNLYRPFSSEALLFDVNYLTTVFQPALAQAAERIFVNGTEAAPRKLSATAG